MEGCRDCLTDASLKDTLRSALQKTGMQERYRQVFGKKPAFEENDSCSVYPLQ